jgi:hypothetical protein
MDSLFSYDDGMLILLPGSAIHKDSIACLSDVSRLDSYLARIKLNTRLPLPLCSCSMKIMAGEIGNHLQSSGIRFLVIGRNFFKSPFQFNAIQSLNIESSACHFIDEKKQVIEIRPTQDVYLLEAEYRSKMKEILIPPADQELTGEGIFGKKGNKFDSIETFRVLFLYLKNNPKPLKFIDIRMDYRFLGAEMTYFASTNFNLLKNKIESFYHSQVNRDMVQYSYSLPPTKVGNESGTHSSPNKKGEYQFGLSNVDGVNQMSRLMFCQWQVEKGWAGKIFSFSEQILSEPL